MVHGLERDQGCSKTADKRSSNVKNSVFSLYDDPDSRTELDNIITFRDFSTVSLHACGDLSPAILKWFTQSRSKSLFLVSCCYHKMTTFPMSLRNLKPSLASHFALRLACQEPFERWLSFTEKEHSQRSKYLGFRSLIDAMESRAVKVKRKALRKSQMNDFEDFVNNCIDRFDFGDVSTETIRDELKRLYSENESNFMLFELIVGLQGFLQILLEYLLVLDRKKYLLEEGFEPEIIRLFDPMLSPRCFVIYCFRNQNVSWNLFHYCFLF